MNVEIIKEKHIHGNVLSEYTRRLTGMTKQQFDEIIAAYEAYRNGIDSVPGISNDEIRQYMITFLILVKLGLDQQLWKSFSICCLKNG